MQVSFTAMADGTAEDFRMIERHDAELKSGLADRILVHLSLSGGDKGAYRIDRLQHALQTADRARAMGADEDWVFGALLHDIGDNLATENHAAVAADVVAPYVRPEVVFTLRHHGAFQGYYYWHHLGGDRRAREKYRDSPFFAHAVAFCHLWDQCSFDPDYETSTLADYRDLVSEVCQRAPFTRREPEGLSAMGIGPAEERRLREVMKPI